jgi:hypothetical protein
VRRILYDVLLDGGVVGVHNTRGSSRILPFRLLTRLYLCVLRTFTYTAPATISLGTATNPGLLQGSIDPTSLGTLTPYGFTATMSQLYTGADDFIVVTVDAGGGDLTDGSMEWWLESSIA